MKTQLHKYSFWPANSKLVLDASEVRASSLELSRLLLISNGTTNTIIYNFGDPAVGVAVVNGLEITLAASMVGMNTTDALLIWYDVVDTTGSVDTSTEEMMDVLEAVCLRLDLMLGAFSGVTPSDEHGINRER